MADIYLIIGKHFEDVRLDDLNLQLALCGLVADSTEKEKEWEDQYEPQNIRRISDPVGTLGFDFIRTQADDNFNGIVIGHILGVGPSSAGISHQYYPASTTLDIVTDAVRLLQENISDPKLYAVYACQEHIGRKHKLGS